MTTEGFTKIVNFISPGAGVLVLWEHITQFALEPPTRNIPCLNDY